MLSPEGHARRKGANVDSNSLFPIQDNQVHFSCAVERRSGTQFLLVPFVDSDFIVRFSPQGVFLGATTQSLDDYDKPIRLGDTRSRLAFRLSQMECDLCTIQINAFYLPDIET